MTALDILNKHLPFLNDEWEGTLKVLAAMKEIYEIGFQNGYDKSHDDHVEGFECEPSLEDRLKELFPEK